MMQIKLIFTTKISHLASFWKWNVLELGNGLLNKHFKKTYSLQTSKVSPEIIIRNLLQPFRTSYVSLIQEAKQ